MKLAQHDELPRRERKSYWSKTDQSKNYNSRNISTEAGNLEMASLATRDLQYTIQPKLKNSQQGNHTKSNRIRHTIQHFSTTSESTPSDKSTLIHRNSISHDH